ncbi:hypothetical protein MRB53_017595 [Persea americana]|uniref:Uncharacterized protein n=1 Tax=Persea americana TaxID=3435 RepID=A0ACC2M543_PERAE|nr:hypothetical protein MRB53_017595 [Persea americana]
MSLAYFSQLQLQLQLKKHLRDTQETHNNMESIVGLVMWRDVPKSAFVFGLGLGFVGSRTYMVNDYQFL